MAFRHNSHWPPQFQAALQHFRGLSTCRLRQRRRAITSVYRE